MVFLVFKKKRALKRIEFEFHKDDDWFIDVNHIMNKSNEVNHTSMITQGRMETWITSYLNEGWEIVEDHRSDCIK